MHRMPITALAIAILACGVLAATPREDSLVPPASAPKAEEKAPPYYSRSNPFAPLPRPEGAPVPPAEEGAPGTEAPRPTGPLPAPPPEPQGQAAAVAPAVPRLNGILFSGALPLAIINDSLVKAGDQVGEWRIVAITQEMVTAEKEGVRYVMTPRRPLPQAQAAPQPPARAAPPRPKTETEARPKPEPADKAKTEAAPQAPRMRGDETPAKGDPKP